MAVVLVLSLVTSFPIEGMTKGQRVRPNKDRAEPGL